VDALKFIEEDMRRSRRGQALGGPLVRGLLLSGLIALGGILARDSLVGIGSFTGHLADVGVAIVAGALPWALQRSTLQPKWRRAFLGLFAVAALLSLHRVVFPEGVRTVYTSTAAFWREAGRCLWKGSVATLFAGVLLGMQLFTLSRSPSRPWRFLGAGAAALMAVAMLGLHCDSSSFSHVALSHWGQGILAGTLLWAGFEAVHLVRVRTALGSSAGRLRGLSRL
jgi:hypothetical protein